MNTESKEIVKLQRPITAFGTSSHDIPVWMAYGEGRQNTAFIPETEITETVRKAMGTDLKGYFLGVWDETKRRWSLGARVEARVW